MGRQKDTGCHAGVRALSVSFASDLGKKNDGFLSPKMLRTVFVLPCLDALQTWVYLPAMSEKVTAHHLIFLVMLGFLLPYTYGGCVAAFSSGDGHKERIVRDTPNDHEDGFSGGFIIVVTEASVDSQNAQALNGLTIRGDTTSIEPEASALDPNAVDTRIATYRPLDFSLTVGYSLGHIRLSPTLFGASQADTIHQSGTVEGRCGGVFSYSLTLDKVSKEFSGHLTFEDYCDKQTTLSGDLDVIGTFDSDTEDVITATLSFDSLLAGSFILAGELSIDFSELPILAVFTVQATDALSGQVYRHEDYSMNITESIDGVDIDLTGTFHHPDHGFVGLATADPLVIHDGDHWPASGQMVIQGANSTAAVLTAVDHLQCGIMVDTTGDGLLDWDSGVLNWIDL